jgi:hypothetical protein
LISELRRKQAPTDSQQLELERDLSVSECPACSAAFINSVDCGPGVAEARDNFNLERKSEKLAPAQIISNARKTRPRDNHATRRAGRPPGRPAAAGATRMRRSRAPTGPLTPTRRRRPAAAGPLRTGAESLAMRCSAAEGGGGAGCASPRRPGAAGRRRRSVTRTSIETAVSQRKGISVAVNRGYWSPVGSGPDMSSLPFLGMHRGTAHLCTEIARFRTNFFFICGHRYQASTSAWPYQKSEQPRKEDSIK